MRKKILIIDDNKNSRVVLADILTEYGYIVMCASGGKEGLELVLGKKPHVVLVDVVMPDMNGNEVCKKIKKMAGDKIKVIIFTGTVDAVDAGKARMSGADDFFVKTDDIDPMIRAIKKFTK